MSADSHRCILHLDADAFFASLEQRDDPKLRGRPVAVGTGVVASCSYEARRWGVSTGMRLTEARWLCRDLIVVPGDYPRYEQAARRMLAICLDRTPVVEVAALDDMYLDLSRDPQPQGIAADLRQQVRDEVELSISIGIGTSKLVAKVATREAKQRKVQQMAESSSARFDHPPLSPLRKGGNNMNSPPCEGGGAGDAEPPPLAKGGLRGVPHLSEGAVLVPAGSERDYLAPHPVRVLPGAGHKIGDRLERLNVQRVGEVAAMPVELLRGLFGKFGRTLHQQANGIDDRPVQPHRPQQSVSRCSSFDPPTGDRDFLRAMVGYLIDRAVSWLRFHELAARGLAVSIRYGDYVGDVGRETLRQASDDDGELREAAQDRFDRLYQRRLPLRLAAIELAPLAPAVRSPTLFPDPAGDRRGRLTACMDDVRRRFGFTALLTGSELLLAEKLDRDRQNFRMRTPCLTR